MACRRRLHPSGCLLTDPAGAITVDLLGRVVAYEDVWGTVTVPNYEAKTGRVLSTSTTPPGGAVIVQEYDCDDADGKVLSVKVNGTQFADPAYASDQLLQSVACQRHQSRLHHKGRRHGCDHRDAVGVPRRGRVDGDGCGDRIRSSTGT